MQGISIAWTSLRMVNNINRNNLLQYVPQIRYSRTYHGFFGLRKLFSGFPQPSSRVSHPSARPSTAAWRLPLPPRPPTPSRGTAPAAVCSRQPVPRGSAAGPPRRSRRPARACTAPPSPPGPASRRHQFRHRRARVSQRLRGPHPQRVPGHAVADPRVRGAALDDGAHTADAPPRLRHARPCSPVGPAARPPLPHAA